LQQHLLQPDEQQQGRQHAIDEEPVPAQPGVDSVHTPSVFLSFPQVVSLRSDPAPPGG
jgi:hypothetical protein